MARLLLQPDTMTLRTIAGIILLLHGAVALALDVPQQDDMPVHMQVEHCCPMRILTTSGCPEAFKIGAVSNLLKQVENLLQEALKALLGDVTHRCHSETPVTQSLCAKLIGHGSHRVATYSWVPTQLPAADGDRQQDLQRRFAIVQPLPAELYADMYELDGAARLSNGTDGVRWRPTPFGALDVEKTAPECEPTVLMIEAAITLPVSHPEIQIRIPLHARYPAPQQRGAPGSLQLRVSSTEMPVHMEGAQFFQMHETGAKCKLPQHSEHTESTWTIPSGSMTQHHLATVGTGLAILLACAVILLSAFHPSASTV